MSVKITLSGETGPHSEPVSVTVDALETLKVIGRAYGLYDQAEDDLECCVEVEDGEDPLLTVQERIGLHGGVFLQTDRVLSDDPEQIQRYLAFRDTLNMLWRLDREGLVQKEQREIKTPMGDTTLQILVVEPLKAPEVREIPYKLSAMREIVGGRLEAMYLSMQEDTVLVCNVSGKSLALPPNRKALDYETGQPRGFVHGTFFVARWDGEHFTSLTEEQMQKYQTMYNEGRIVPIRNGTSRPKPSAQER